MKLKLLILGLATLGLASCETMTPQQRALLEFGIDVGAAAAKEAILTQMEVEGGGRK